MQLTIEPALTNWLAARGKDTLTIGALISKGGGCCGGCAFVEPIIDLGEPKDDSALYSEFKQDGLTVYINKVLLKRTDRLALYLKGIFLKRVGLKGYEADCHWKK